MHGDGRRATAGAAGAAASSCSRSESRAGGIWAIAADTDGIDGTEDNAGAMLTPDFLRRACQSERLDAKAILARHDSYGFFSALGDLVVTGPTRTNVNDYRAILVRRGSDEGQIA